MFPGLGSRASYQNLDSTLLDSGVPAVAEVYRAGARVLGLGDRRDGLLMVPDSLPQGRLAQQGFIGAAIMVHNLALHAHLHATASAAGTPVTFAAYTGESFGILAAAAASGALDVDHCLAIAHVFTPLMLLAADGPTDEPLVAQISGYLPSSVRGRGVVPEPAHVVAVRADPAVLGALQHDITRTWGPADVEIHKLYSSRQINLYVRAGVRQDVATLVARHPGASIEELKAPTTFLAHSHRMQGVRTALARYMDDNGIAFRAPHTPVIANAGAGRLTSADEVRDAVLAMTDTIMDSRSTAATVDSLEADVVVELGLGGRAVELLTENGVETPVVAYTGPSAPVDLFIRTVGLVARLRNHLHDLHAPGAALGIEHLDTLRALFRAAAESPVSAHYLRRTMGRVVLEEMLDPQHTGASAYYDLLEIYQHTTTFRAAVDITAGELVTRARVKKRVNGDPLGLGQAYAELQVVTATNEVVDRLDLDTTPAEVVVVHLDGMADLTDAEVRRRVEQLRQAPDVDVVVDREPLVTESSAVLTRIEYQYSAARLLQHHRPAMFAQTCYYLLGGDEVGWLTALALSGAAQLADVARFVADGGDQAAAERLAEVLCDADVPVLSPDGVPLQYHRDLAAVTGVMLAGGTVAEGPRRLRFSANSQVIAVGTPHHPELVDGRPHHIDVITVAHPTEIWRRAGSALDELEERSTLGLTTENGHVMRYAQSRRLLSTTVAAYIDVGERVVGFGKGGSESMAVFLRRDVDGGVRVRKVLSEALTTVAWDPHGTGVMLPPFEKAKKQAEYLLALPESLRDLFPRVFDMVEREIPVPPHLRKNGRQSYRELIYDMSYVPGEEISRFVEMYTPPPAVVARLYEQVISLLHERVHSVGRTPGTGDTLEPSYFTKIEDRLGLCRATAPSTFGPDLLDHATIIVNGVSYLNLPELLRRFRSRPDHLRVLEPRTLSLVMGDTNTENIKIDRVQPLLRAQQVIESGAPRAEIDAALAAITADALGITFLDPRAIGFRSAGGSTVDDPMYDNKPWHNSIGHYDEIHYEQFDLRFNVGRGRVPNIDIAFWPDNPYQQAYRVRDVAVHDGPVDPAHPRGIEDHFGEVMTRAHRLDDPASLHSQDDPYWLVRFVFLMGTHFAAMPPFHFQSELDGRVVDTAFAQRRPVAIYCEGVKWLNWALELLDGTRTEFLGVPCPALPRSTEKGANAA